MSRYEQLSYELWSLPRLLGGFEDKGRSDHFVTAALGLFTACTTIKAATLDLWQRAVYDSGGGQQGEMLGMIHGNRSFCSDVTSQPMST